jgi:hypothetical protein
MVAATEAYFHPKGEQKQVTSYGPVFVSRYLFLTDGEE